MSEASAQSVLSAHGFPSGLSDLPLSELEYLAQELDAVIAQKRKADRKPSEGELLLQINTTVLNAEDRSRYWVLAEKLEADQLTDGDHQEFMKLVDKDEKLRNNRLKLLIELAQMRNITLPKLMENLGLAPVFNG
ncbi:MAG: hypothetical protein KA138_01360 [Saprospiraceae bacterium]|jgi:hypothetical protein|nr:hypothetical protein [Lewinellaceae bacterium]MBP6810140.1 hypothetical protein [Saprospiraceae bacterium]